MIMTKSKQPEKRHSVNLADGHHMGKHTGYDVHDGKIYPAKALTDNLHSEHDKRQGLDRYVETLNSFILQQYEQIAAQERIWWQHIAEDLGLDKSAEWVYDYLNKSIQQRTKKAESKPK